MSGLKLGDIHLDPRRVVYMPSLRAVVCSGLPEALRVGIGEGLRRVVERVDGVLEDYKPESLIILSSLKSETSITGIVRRWGKKTRIQFVANDADVDAQSLAEALRCEVHKELIWGNYRFVESELESNSELSLLTIIGSPHYMVRVGKGPMGGMKLCVFLKGQGKVLMPSSNPQAAGTSIFKKELERFDVFAIGHQRVLPMGKVADLKPFKGIVRGLPLGPSTFSGSRKAHKEPSTGN